MKPQKRSAFGPNTESHLDLDLDPSATSKIGKMVVLHNKGTTSQSTAGENLMLLAL
jgi:hypothetical protein